jgi:hypothetical protein
MALVESETEVIAAEHGFWDAYALSRRPEAAIIAKCPLAVLPIFQA